MATMRGRGGAPSPTLELREPRRVFTWVTTAATAIVGMGLAVLALLQHSAPLGWAAGAAGLLVAVGLWQIGTDRDHPGILLLPGGLALVLVVPLFDADLVLVTLVGFALAVTAAGYFVSRRWAFLLTGFLLAAAVTWIVRSNEGVFGTGLEAGLLVVAVAAGSWVHDRNALVLRRTVLRRATLFTNAADAIVVVDAAQRIVEANEAAATTFGYPSCAELVGRDLAELVPPRFREAHAGHVAGFFASDEPRRPMNVRGKIWARRADGSEFPCEITIAKVPLGRHSGVMAVVHDVTEREEARRQAQEMAEARLRLVASVSHEVRTPLSAVLGFAELLQMDTAALSEPERVELVGLIADQALELANLVDDLLAGARAELGELQVVRVPVDLRAQAVQVLERGVVAPRRDVEVVGEAAAWGDPARIRQIVRNLVTNAVRYGGPEIRIIIARRGDVATLSVVDNGPGVPEELRDRIFEPFASFGGEAGQVDPIGLGLTIVRHLAELMGGTVHYEYAPGRSAFCLELEAAEGAG
jgi:PAS domain S-box